MNPSNLNLNQIVARPRLNNLQNAGGGRTVNNLEENKLDLGGIIARKGN